MKKRDVHRPAVNGRIGEDLTVYYLTKKGYNILCRNYRIRGAEIDIIAENGEFIIFVEVKSHSLTNYVPSAEAVYTGQSERIHKAAETYLYRNPCELQPRFDIAAVTLKNNRPYRFEYYDNAF